MARHEAVVREDRRQPGESGEAGVRGKQQDDRRRDLNDVVEGSTRPHDRLRHHAVDRFLLPDIRLDPDGRREPGDRDEDRREDRAHEDQGFDRVRLLGSPEARHAVRDRLAARQPDRAGRECSKDEQKRQRSGSFLRERIRRRHGRRRIAGKDPKETERDQPVHRDHVCVRRPGEEESCLAHAAQVSDDEQCDESEAGHHAVVVQLGYEARDRGDAGGSRDGDGQHVVDEERRCRDESRDDAVVLARDEVAAAAVWVCADDARLRQDDDREDEHDRDRDRHREREGRRPRESKNAHGLFGRVRGRRDVVGREDRQARCDADAFLPFGLGLQALADQKAQGRVPRLSDSASRFHGLLGGGPAAAVPAESAPGRPDDPNVAVAYASSRLAHPLLE